MKSLKGNLILYLVISVIAFGASRYIYLVSLDYMSIDPTKKYIYLPIILFTLTSINLFRAWRRDQLNNMLGGYIIVLVLLLANVILFTNNKPDYTYEQAREIIEMQYETIVLKTEIKAIHDLNSIDYPHYYYRIPSKDAPLIFDPYEGHIREFDKE